MIRRWNDNGVIFQWDGMVFSTALIECAMGAGICFDYAVFENRDLSAINMDGQTFEYTHFIGCNLSGANMSEAVFRHCRFDHCDLTGTCMAESILSHCDFSGSSFADSDFFDATMNGCIFTCPSIFNQNINFCRQFIDIKYINESGFMDFDHPPTIIHHHAKRIVIGDDTVLYGEKMLDKGRWQRSVLHRIERNTIKN